MEAFDHCTVDAISSSGNSQCRSFDYEEKEALGFGCLLFDSSPIFIAKDASSSNEMSTSRSELFKLEFDNVQIFQIAARSRDSLREFQLSDD